MNWPEANIQVYDSKTTSLANSKIFSLSKQSTTSKNQKVVSTSASPGKRSPNKVIE